jgi:LysM repeat protein
MSRITRVVVAVSLAAASLSTLTLPATTFAAPPTTVPTEYVVKAGDFLAGIAAKVGVALPQLLTANQMTAKSLILPGQKLVVPVGAITPTPALAPAAPAAPAPATLTYTVVSGDYLMGIASAYKVTVADLLAANKLTLQSLIVPGRQLALPANAVAPAVVAPVVAAPAAAVPAALTYTVKSGDFLAGIATAYKVKLSDLLSANKMTAKSLIVAGTQLALPAGAVAPAPAPAAASSAAAIQSVGGQAGTVVNYAYAQLGKPYRFFSAGPESFDCSGLTKAAYAQIGVELVHQSAAQASYGTAVDIANDTFKPGDLIFMAPHGTGIISHVGIAVDATHWIHSPKPGDVVRLAPIPPRGLLSSVRRLIP